MIESTRLDRLPLWAFFLTTLAIALLAGESGYQVGGWSRSADAAKLQSGGTAVNATLGLLAFLLAFTFGLAASRYDSRRSTFQTEVNAIGTTYLRTSFLPEPQGSIVRALLRDYVDTRLETAKPEAAVDSAIKKCEKIQNELWTHAATVGRDLDKPGAPNSDMLALFVDSLNETIEAHSNRIGAVVRARVPAAMWTALFLIAVIALFAMGYDAGRTETSRPVVGFGMILCFAVTMWLIADLDRPLEGFIRVNQQGMIDLRASMDNHSETPE